MRVRSLAFAAFVILFNAGQVAACTMTGWSPDSLVENKPAYSANGRFCVVVRWYEVPDFTSERAGKVFGLDNGYPAGEPGAAEKAPPPPRTTVTAALYEFSAKGRKPVTEIPLDVGSVVEGPESVLVADSGRYLVAVRGFRIGPCKYLSNETDPMVTIYEAGGTRVGTLRADDILSNHDLQRLRSVADIEFKLRHETQEREVVVLSIPGPPVRNGPRSVERRIDVATATLLDEKREIFPSFHAWATPVIDARPPGKVYASPSSDSAAVYGDPNLVQIDSARLFSQVVRGPGAVFPPIAEKAHITGTVWVQVVVSERGEVLCTRSTPFAFGLSEAAEEAARRWRFKTFFVDGHPVKVSGELLFHFQDVDQDTWCELLRKAPPAGE